MKTSVAIGALIAVALSFHPEALPGPFDQTLGIEPQGNKDVPEKVLYEMYFRRVAFFEDLANRPDQGDLSRIKIRAKIIEELGIDEAQRDALLQISRHALEEAATLDAQAREIINRERARYPGGEIKDANQVPQIPAELQSLQQARDAIFTNAKSQLLNQLGKTIFDEIDFRIKSIVLPNVKVINPK